MIDNLESERLILEPISIQHVTNVYLSWLNDEDIIKHLVTKKGHTLKSLSNYIQSHLEKKTVMYAIIIKENKTHIGNIKIDPINKSDMSGELGILIGDKSSWGKGYGKEVIHCLTKYGFETLRLARIEAWCYEKNTGSLRAFLSIGYSIEGFMKKKYISDGVRCGAFELAMLREEFNSQNSAGE